MYSLLLAEIGRPDDVAADPHAPVEPRDHGAFGGRGDPQAFQPCAHDALGGGDRRDDPAVDDRAHGGADQRADGRAREAEDRAAEAHADAGADDAEIEVGNGCDQSPERHRKAKAILRAQDGVSGSAITPSRS